MRPLSKYFLISLVASITLAGCEANLRKEISLRGNDAESASFKQRVVVELEAFSKRHGFSCSDNEAPRAILSCRARGPRFLELLSSQTTFTVSLNQPYPGGLWSKAPHEYVAASEDLENVFKREFGDTVVVISK